MAQRKTGTAKIALLLLLPVLAILGGCSTGTPGSTTVATLWVANHSFDSQPGNSLTPVSVSPPHVDASVTTASQPSSIAVTTDGVEVLVTNKGKDTLSIIDAASREVTHTIGVGLEPDAVAVGPTSQQPLAVVANFGDNDVSVVNLEDHTVVATIPVGAEPDAVAIAPGGTGDAGLALVGDFASNQVTAIDLGTLRSRGNIAVGVEPDAIAVGSPGNRPTAFVANFGQGTVTPIDLETGFPGTPIPVLGAPTDIVITSASSTAYVTGGNGITPINLATKTQGTEIATPGLAEAIALDESTNTAWVAEDQGYVVAVDLDSGRAGVRLHVGGKPSAIVLSRVPKI